MLRGPQSPGELRARADRLHPFAHRGEVEATLQSMAELPQPLVREMDLQAGQHDRRWVHLLGPLPHHQAAAAAEPQVDRDVVLREGASARDERVREGYDRVAEAYAEQFADELAGKPFDRWLLDRVAEVAGPGPIADVGCGPGHTTAHLADMGTAVTGFDVAPGMVAAAQLRFPELDFEVGDLRNLLRPPAAAAWQGVVAWYALVHLAGSELPEALASLTRVLAPGGWLALALHVGEAVWPVTELCGEPVELEFVLHDRDEVLAAVTAAGLVDVEWYLRAPYPASRRPPNASTYWPAAPTDHRVPTDASRPD